MPDGAELPALWWRPQGAGNCLVLAHGAGAGMRHPGVAGLAEGLAARGVATMRFEFPYMARGSRRPDPPPVAQAAVRSAVAAAAERAADLPLFAGGRSFGGRMTSQAQANSPLPRVRGLVFFAFPLHPAGRPGVERAAHLADVQVPMLFLQGSRDDLADLALLERTVEGLAARATLVLAPEADHSFHVKRSTGLNGKEGIEGLLDACAAWMDSVASG
jgi:predicted alpha/beta-hydrolase family hydrolase